MVWQAQYLQWRRATIGQKHEVGKLLFCSGLAACCLRCLAGRTGRWHHALFNLTLHAILAPCFSRLVLPALQVNTLLNNTKFMAQESKFSMVPRAFLLNPLGFPASGFNPTPVESKDWTCKYNWKR